jgi:NADH:ubiquinone oxidoreductase subunit E
MRTQQWREKGGKNMLKKLSSIPFNGTAEQKAKLMAVIEAHKSDKSTLMAVMQEAQGIYGYLPIEVQAMIAEGMEVPLEKVYGVSTFYAQFSLTPKGDCHISVCLGTAATLRAPATSTTSSRRFSASPVTSAPLTESSLSPLAAA